jgi:hypothetical protein
MRRFAWIILAAAAGCANAPTRSDQYDVRVIEPAHPGEPTSLLRAATPDTFISALALTDDYVFFTSGKGIYRLPKFGGKLVAIDADGDARYEALATQGEEVLWTRSSGDLFTPYHTWIKRRAPGGGPETVVADGEFAVSFTLFNENMLLGGDNIYFLRDADTFAKYPISGGAPQDFTVPNVDSERHPVDPDWVADGNTIYTSECRDYKTTCALIALDTVSGTSSVVMPLGYHDAIQAVDETSLYFQSDDRLWKLDKTDHSVTELYAADKSRDERIHWTVVVDAANVYFVTYQNNYSDWTRPIAEVVRSLPKAGGPSTIIGEGASFAEGFPWQIAADAHNLYIVMWTVPSQILMLPKTRSAATAG